jgi:rhodanese-related sulfurtransferase
MQEQLKNLNPEEAWHMCQENSRALLIDIRSSMEHLFVGHPKGSIHVPWIDEPEWTVNPNFVTDIRKLILGGVVSGSDASVPIILICRSGKRSKEAGELLLANDFHNVYNITEGFEGELDENHHRSTVGGWRYHNLPWNQC